VVTEADKSKLQDNTVNTKLYGSAFAVMVYESEVCFILSLIVAVRKCCLRSNY
jgi:hypothetical protein